MALAWKFGASGVVDAYRLVILLLLYGQQLFVSYILPFVVVPIFAEYRAQGREEDAWILVDSVGTVFLVFGTLIAALLFVRPDWVVRVIGPGLTGEARTAALFFTRWCSLAFIPICWTGAACGVLYAHNVFTINPIAQLCSNIVLLCAILAAGSKLGAVSLVIGVLGGALVNTIVFTLGVLRVRRKAGSRFQLRRFDFRSIYKALRVASPLFGSLIAAQSTTTVVTRSLSRLPPGNIAVFGYAWRLSGMAQLVPTALSTILFPKFSETWYSQGEQEFARRCGKALRAAVFIVTPLTCAAYVYRRPIIMLLLYRGAFSFSDVNSSSVLLGLLILGIPASTVVGYIDRMFYSLQETKLPVLMDLTGNAFELAFIPLLASRFGARGVAFAYMLLSWIIGAGLLGLIKKKIRSFPLRDLGSFGLWSVLTSVVSVWAGASFGNVCANFAHFGPVLSGLIEVAAGGSLSLILYCWVNVLLGFPEARKSRDFIGHAVRASFSHVRGGASQWR